MQECMYKTPTGICDTSDLSASVTCIPHSVINTAVDQQRIHPRACLKAKDGYFQHLLQPTGTFQSHLTTKSAIQSHPWSAEYNVLCHFWTQTCSFTR